jgi:hypothetical protein
LKANDGLPIVGHSKSRYTIGMDIIKCNRAFWLTIILGLALAKPPRLMAADAGLAAPLNDWLINPAPFKAGISFNSERNELALENGLVRRTLRLSPSRRALLKLR